MNQLIAAQSAQGTTALKPNNKPARSLHDLENDQKELEACFEKLNVSSGGYQAGAQYVHQNLDDPTNQIRLIVLPPASDKEAELTCTLQVVTLSEAKSLSFTAVSYACGDQSNRRDISINSLKLSITYNLHELLINLRHATEYQRVWADAISIHQTNLHEKAQQILLMQDIYSLATQVFIWLGPSDDELDVLFKQLLSASEGDMTKQTMFFYNIFQNAKEHTVTTLAFIKLWQKPWFSRMWCAQEYLLASSTPLVACGSARIPWNVINTAMTAVDMIWPDRKSAVQKQLQRASTQSMAGAMGITFKQRKLTLGEALHYTSARQATDPRDKVYAILGLVAPAVRLGLAPDYTQPLNTVYQKAMVAICKERMVLTPLWAAADMKTNLNLKLPSWCLDFSDTHWQDSFVQLHEFPLLWAGQVAGACGMKPPIEPGHLEHDLNTGRLIVHGTIVGIVQKPVVMSFTPSVRELSRLEELLIEDPAAISELVISQLKSEIVAKFFQDIDIASELYTEILSTQDDASTVEKRLRSGEVWQSFIRGASNTEILGPIWTKSGLLLPKENSHFETFRLQLNGKPEPSTWDHDISPEAKAQTSKDALTHDCIIKSCLALARAIPDRTFIATDNGYRGRASMDVQAGDLLCIIFRCGRPLVLRPGGVDARGEEVYELVASAWVAEMMGGQFLRQGGFVRRSFTII